MVPRYHGIMVPRYHGTMVSRHHGDHQCTLVPWHRCIYAHGKFGWGLAFMGSSVERIPNRCSESLEHRRIPHGIRYRGGMVSDMVPHPSQTRIFCKTEPNCPDSETPRYRFCFLGLIRLLFGSVGLVPAGTNWVPARYQLNTSWIPAGY